MVIDLERPIRPMGQQPHWLQFKDRIVFIL